MEEIFVEFIFAIYDLSCKKFFREDKDTLYGKLDTTHKHLLSKNFISQTISSLKVVLNLIRVSIFS